MSDLISRQAAIEALDEYFERIGKLKRRGLNKGEKAISLDTVGAIKSLPPAQPEPKKGKWIRNGWAITCSECGYDMPYTVRRFCPSCGADMREETT